MYILYSGTVRVEKKTVAKDKFTVANFQDNFTFGEIALMDDDVRSASVYAVTNCECYVIKKGDFEKLCEENPKIGYYIVKEIAKSLTARLRKTTRDNVQLVEALISEDINGY